LKKSSQLLLKCDNLVSVIYRHTIPLFSSKKNTNKEEKIMSAFDTMRARFFNTGNKPAPPLFPNHQKLFDINNNNSKGNDVSNSFAPSSDNGGSCPVMDQQQQQCFLMMTHDSHCFDNDKFAQDCKDAVDRMNIENRGQNGSTGFRICDLKNSFLSMKLHLASMKIPCWVKTTAYISAIVSFAVIISATFLKVAIPLEIQQKYYPPLANISGNKIIQACVFILIVAAFMQFLGWTKQSKGLF
jgi:hypothetical protein